MLNKLIYLLLLNIIFLTISFNTNAQDIKINGIDNFRLKGINGNEVTIGFTANIQNSTSRTIKVGIKKGQLFKNDKLAGTFELSEKIKIKKKSEQQIPIVVVVKTEKGLNLLTDGLSLMMGGSVKLKAAGVVKGTWLIFSKKYPFEVQENLSLRDFNGL
jgi:hypothetical protein